MLQVQSSVGGGMAATIRIYRVLAKASKGGGEHPFFNCPPPSLLSLVEFDVVTMECKEFQRLPPPFCEVL